METPSSTTRVTRSQALASSGNKSNIPMSKKVEGTEKGAVKSRQRTGKQQDRSALIDITNDSPIVGLAMESLETPSTVSKKKTCGQVSGSSKAPGSGEALLRGQVKTLLQKVEEDAEFSKISFDDVYGDFEGIVLGLPATLNNTPFDSDTSSPVAISQIVTEVCEGENKEGSVESGNSMLTKSLLSEKSEGSCDSSDCTSVLTYQVASAGSKVRSATDDADASIWSIQVNASTKDVEDDDDDVEDEDELNNEEEDDYENEEEDVWDDIVLDDLCEGLSKIGVEMKFAGKHTRFLYNSDGELEGEEECDADESVEAGVLRLKGLPTPKGSTCASQ